MKDGSKVMHRRSPEYIYARDRHHLAVRILAERDALKGAELIWWHRGTTARHTVGLELGLSDRWHSEWRTVLSFEREVKYIKYHFRLTDADGSVWYLGEMDAAETAPEDGLSFEFSTVGSGDYDDAPAWVGGTVFYQIFPERFAGSERKEAPREYVPWDSLPDRESFHGGSIRGIIEHLGYLEDLHVGCIYLTPVFRADFNHKYATTDYFSIDPDFGTDDDMRSLIAEVHRRGMRIILDGVFNHTGVNFPPFRSLIEEGKKSKYASWYYVHSWPIDMEKLSYECVGDYCWMPKLNTGNTEVQDYILGVMDYWIREFGIDGWRLDVADEVEGSLWSRARRMIRERYPDCVLLGETWGDAANLVGDTLKLDIMMNYGIRNAILENIVKRSDPAGFVHHVSTVLMKYRKSVRLGAYNLLGSHDTERIASDTDDGRRVDLAFAALFTLPGSPAIYYGDEVGMKGGNDPGCRGGMVWEEERQDRNRLEIVRRLAGLKRSEAALREGSLRFLSSNSDDGWVRWERRSGEEVIRVVLNLSEKELEEDVSGEEILFMSGKSNYGSDAADRTEIPPVSCLITKRRSI